MAKFGFPKIDFSGHGDGKSFITHGAVKEKHHAKKDRIKMSLDPGIHPSNEYITINVSGAIFKTKSETLSRFPDTLLGNQMSRLKHYDERTGELFFDRHSPTFHAILYYYQSNGQIIKPPSVSPNLFKEELMFFKIKFEPGLLEPHFRNRCSLKATPEADTPEDEVGPKAVDPINTNPAYQNHKPVSRNGSRHCIKPLARRETVAVMDGAKAREAPLCGATSNTRRNSRNSLTVSTPMEPRKDSNPREQRFSPLPSIGKPTYQYHTRLKLKVRVYDILDHPETSMAAKIFSWISMSLIVLSVATFIAETMPDYEDDLKKVWYETSTGIFFFSFETCCIVFFTFELLGRFLTCPNKKTFVKNKLNIIDLISILPYYLELIIPKKEDSDGNLNSIGSLVILRVLRLFRVLRIFKLSRHSRNMLAFGIALKASLAELLSLGLFLAIDIIVFASAAYYAEMEEVDTPFYSIPASCWWAVVTVTTLGYGDMRPSTTLGKFVGTLCVFSGILVIAFQMPIMVAKFTFSFMRNTTETSESEEEDELDEYEEEPLVEEKETDCRPANGGTRDLLV